MLFTPLHLPVTLLKRMKAVFATKCRQTTRIYYVMVNPRGVVGSPMTAPDSGSSVFRTTRM